MSRQTYKNYHGGHEELLTKNNYELWASVIQRELEGKYQWGFIDDTRQPPDALPANSPATDQLLYYTLLKEHRAEQSAAGSYIYNACSKIVQERYLYETSLSKPKEIWNKLKEKLQGNDEESRSKLLTKFMTMEKTVDMNIEQFANQLKRIRGLLNGGKNQPQFITEKMVIGQIFANAGPSLEFLTSNLRTTPNLTLADVLHCYELAEESKDDQEYETEHNDTVAALYAQDDKKKGTMTKWGGHQQQQAPRNLNLPVCPANWNGRDCWYHSPHVNHKAYDCDALGEFQRRYLVTNSIDIKDAAKLHGYPFPETLPRPLTNNFNPSNQHPKGSGFKRPLCGLCDDVGHSVDLCPRLQEAANALKKVKTAAVAEEDLEENILDRDEVSPL